MTEDAEDENSQYYRPETPGTHAFNWIVMRNLHKDDDDWMPFATALYAQHRELGEKADRTGNRAPDTGVARPGSPVPVGNSRGKFDYVTYIPPWTDPDFRVDRVVRNPEFVYVNRPERDVMSRMRPALRPEDAPHNPTLYAQRWGINPDRRDGRSRLSPTNAVSRKFLPALQAQLTNVPAVDKFAMEEETQKQKAVPILEHFDRPAISLQVFEDYKRNKGMPSLVELIRDPLFNRSISELQALDVTESTQDYVQKLQEIVEDDRDFQRQFFSGWTTDELIEQNVLTMSDETESDLDLNRPLHPWLLRSKWEDTVDTRGESGYTPRFVYSVGGKREEYDVRANDRIWEALQPALQLVTRVLEARPRMYEALKDLRTRQPIERQPPLGRYQDKYNAITRMVPLDEVELHKCYGAVQELEEMGWNSVQEVERILLERLELGLGSIFLGAHGEEGVPYNVHWGVTMSDDNDTKISIILGAEMVWPLLVPEYSASEKMTASFALAATLLHELAHAMTFAVTVLLDHGPQNQDPVVTALLKDLRLCMLNDKDVWQEPFFKGQRYSEAGYALETDLFAQTIGILTENSDALMSGLFPLVLYGRPYSFGGEELDWIGGWRTQTTFCWPVSINWIQRFFQTSFWEETVPTWGLDVVKLLPHDIPRLVVAKSNYTDLPELERLFGTRAMKFFRVALQLLWEQRMFILRDYCLAVLANARGDLSFRSRWHREALAWKNTDWDFVPVLVNLRELKSKVEAGAEALKAAQNTNLEEARSRWCARFPAAKQIPLENWLHYMETVINDSWKIEGGEVMRPVQQLYTILRKELGDNQIYVYQYFTASAASRRVLYRPDPKFAFDKYEPYNEPFDYVMEFFRSYRDAANTVADMLIAAAGQLQNLDAPDWDTWVGWGNRFRQIAQVAVDVLAAVDADVAAGDAGLSDQHIDLLLSQLWVASGHRKTKDELLKKLVQRELEVVDPCIRDTFFEFQRRLCELVQRPIPSTELVENFEMPKFASLLRGVIDGLRNIPLGQPAKPPDQAPSFSGMFQFNPPPTASAPARNDTSRSSRRWEQRMQRRKKQRRTGRRLNEDYESAVPSGLKKFTQSRTLRRRRMRRRIELARAALRRIKELGSTRALEQRPQRPVSFGEMAQTSQEPGANAQERTEIAGFVPPSTLPPPQRLERESTSTMFPDPWATSDIMTFAYDSRLRQTGLGQNPRHPRVASNPRSDLATILSSQLWRDRSRSTSVSD